MSLPQLIARVALKQDLNAEEAGEAFDVIFAGHASAENLAAFIVGLRDKGETADEILGAAQAMRRRMVTIKAPDNAMDIVGTGGDAHGTLNISTAVAIVVAACGVPVAKHGNRAASGRSGSSDVLATLGINLDASPQVLELCLREANLCFMFAPRHHPAMRHVVELRQKLKSRTIFNLLGPLTNPANVRKHLIGVYSKHWLESMAQVLQQLGSTHAWLSCGQDGMDEITTTAPTDTVVLRDGILEKRVIEPEQAGIARARIEVLKGGEAPHNAAELKRLLQGQRGTYRDIVLLNAAAALIIADKAKDLREGVATASQAIDNGMARETLEELIALTNENVG